MSALGRTRATCALLLAAGAFALVGCGGSDSGAAPTTTTTTTRAPSTTTTTAPASATEQLFEQVCSGAPVVTDTGTLESDQITEASGIAASRRTPGVWWVHNDSGDSARIFAIDEQGALLQTVDLRGATAQDWEDIAVGPPIDEDGAGTIYVGDIGDNLSTRESVRIFRLTEPAVRTSTGASPTTTSSDVDTLTFTYPDGAHDAEALLVDPIGGDLFIVTKDWSGAGQSQVYRAPGGLADGSTTVLEHVATVALPAGTLVTAADVSPDGTVVALRSYNAVSLYERPAGEPLESAFSTTPCEGPVPTERQGEAIGFAADGGSYLTLSEGTNPTLHRTGP